MSSSISALVAFPVFTMKFACFSDTTAPPTLCPLRFVFSISSAALKCCVFLNMLPALNVDKGCFSFDDNADLALGQQP